MSKKRPGAFVAQIVFACLLAGGSGALLGGCSDTAKPSVAALNACAMVDPAAAAKILGETVTVKPIDSAAAQRSGVSLCNYETQTLHQGFMVTVGPHGLSDVAADSPQQMADNVKTSKEMLPDLKVELTTLSGLGEAAYLITTQAYAQVYVYKGAYRVMINRDVAPTPEAVAATRKIAGLALASMP